MWRPNIVDIASECTHLHCKCTRLHCESAYLYDESMSFFVKKDILFR
jgi:hypothetical protein